MGYWGPIQLGKGIPEPVGFREAYNTGVRFWIHANRFLAIPFEQFQAEARQRGDLFNRHSAIAVQQRADGHVKR